MRNPRRVLLVVAFLALAVPAWAQEPGGGGDDQKGAAFQKAFQEGMTAIDQGKFEDGIAAFKKAIEIDASDHTSYYNIACCYSRLGKKAEAVDWLRKSIEMGFGDVEHIEKDTDLDAIRQEKGYQDAVTALKASAAGTEQSGGPLKYELVTPKDYDKAKAVPLVVALHGYGGEAKTFANLWKELADAAGVLVVCPQGPKAVPGAGFSWEGAGPEAVAEAIDKVQAEHAVDESRIYLAGYSMGATVALKIALIKPGEYAGVLSIAGDYDQEHTKPLLAEAKKGGLAVVLYAGEKDARYLAQNRQMKGDLEAATVPLLYKEYAVGHELPPNPKEEIKAAYEWLSAQPRPEKKGGGEPKKDGGPKKEPGPKAPEPPKDGGGGK